MAKFLGLRKPKKNVNPLRVKFIQSVRRVIKRYHQEYIDRYPDHFLSYLRMGYVCSEDGEDEKAVEMLLKATELGAQDSSKLHRTLGRCCYNVWKKCKDPEFLTKSNEAYQVCVTAPNGSYIFS